MKGSLSLEVALILASVGIAVFIFILDLMMIARTYLYLSELKERFSMNYEINVETPFSNIVQEFKRMAAFFTGLPACSPRVQYNCFRLSSSETPNNPTQVGIVTITLNQKTNFFDVKQFEMTIPIYRNRNFTREFQVSLNFE